MHRFRTGLLITAFAVVGLFAPAAHATGYDGYKSSYPQLHALRAASDDAAGYDGYKSSLPELREARAYGVAWTAAASGGGSFNWTDAAIGVLLGVSASGVIAIGMSYRRRGFRITASG